MNRNPSNSLPLLTAIDGNVNYKTAEELLQRSVNSYGSIKSGFQVLCLTKLIFTLKFHAWISKNVLKIELENPQHSAGAAIDVSNVSMIFGRVVF